MTTKFIFARSRSWTTLLPLPKTLPGFYFQPCWFLKQSCRIVPDIELADITVVLGLGVYNDRRVQGYSLRPPRKYKPTKRAFWRTRNLHGIVWNSGSLDCTEIPIFFQKDVKGEYFAKGTEKRKILGNFLDKKVENLDEQGCPKFQDFVDEDIWFSWVAFSDTRPHFTVQSVGQKCLVTGQCSDWSCKFCIVNFFVSFYATKSFKMMQPFLPSFNAE